MSIVSVSALNTVLITATLDLLETFFPPTAFTTATVAASYVTVMGLTYASVFEMLAQAKLEGKDKETIEKFLQNAFREKFAKYASTNVRSREALALIGEIYKNEN